MRRSFFLKKNSEVNDVTPTSKLTQQINLLNRLLGVIITLGLVSFAANMPAVFSSGWFAGQIILGLGIIWLFVILKIRRFSYRTRVLNFLLILAVIGQVLLFAEGLTSGARLFMLMLPFFSIIFLGRREGIIALVYCGFSMVAAVFAINYRLIPNPDPIAFNMVTELWIDSIINFFFVALPMTLSVSAIVTVLEKSLYSEESLLSRLKERQSVPVGHTSGSAEEIQNLLKLTRIAVEICTSINQLIDPDELLDRVVELVKERFNLYFVGVFVIEENRSGFIKSALLRAGSGDEGQQMCHAGYRLAVDATSTIGWVIMNQKARVSQDTGSEVVHFNNPFLPLTRTELVLPLISGEHVLGAMTIQSMQPSAFDDEDIPVYKSVADALAKGLENSRKFSEARRNLDEARIINQQYIQQAWSQFAENRGDLYFDYVNESNSSEMATNQIKLPLSLRDQVIGEITLERKDPSLSEEEQAFVDAVINQAALALENARLLDATQKRAGTERLVSDIMRKVRASNELEAIMRITIQELGRILQASDGIIRLEGITSNESPGFDPKLVDPAGSRS